MKGTSLLGHLFEATELASMTIAERENYEHEMRTELDIIAELQFAVEKSREDAYFETARRMLKDKVPVQQIAKWTGLNETQITNL